MGGSFQVFVKTLTGQTVTLDLEDGDATTVGRLAEKFADKEGIPADQLRLAFAGKQIWPQGASAPLRVAGSGATVTEETPISHWGVRKEATVFMVLRLRGGTQLHARLAAADRGGGLAGPRPLQGAVVILLASDGEPDLSSSRRS